MKAEQLIDRLSLLPPSWEIEVNPGNDDPDGWNGTIDQINLLESESRIELTLRFK